MVDCISVCSISGGMYVCQLLGHHCPGIKTIVCRFSRAAKIAITDCRKFMKFKEHFVLKVTHFHAFHAFHILCFFPFHLFYSETFSRIRVNFRTSCIFLQGLQLILEHVMFQIDTCLMTSNFHKFNASF